MSRLTAAADRVIVLLVGLALIAVGALAIDWYARGPVPLGRAIVLPWWPGLAGQGWWPWALVGAAVVLVLVALRWLVAHTPASRAGTLRLTGEPDVPGAVTVELGAVADAAAAALARHPDVRSATARAVVERGVRTVTLSATARSPLTLAAVFAAAADTGRELTAALPDTGVAVRTVVRAGRGSDRP